MLVRPCTTPYCLILVCMFVGGHISAQDARGPDFGRQWVASNPFTLTGLCQTEATFDLDEYKQVGFNSLLAWKTRAGLLSAANDADFPIHIHKLDHGGATPELQAEIRALVEAYPNITAFVINDEPKLTQMRATQEILDWLRQEFPDRLAYSNAYPIGATGPKYSGDADRDYSYGDYIRDYARIVRPDVLMFDIYPFSAGGGRVSDHYFFNLSLVRDVALKARIPYWAFIQSYETTDRRLPSESDLRMQLFSNLTYGFTGFSYFTYDVAFDRGLLEADGTPNSAYTYAEKVNPEIMHLGNVIRKLVSTDVRFVAASSAATPTNLPRWEPRAGGDPFITAIKDTQLDAEHPTGLVGFFRSPKGKRYFMLTNLTHDAHLSAEDATRTYTIGFKRGVKNIYRINRSTGETDTLPVADGELVVTLPGGTGDLFMYKQ